MIIFLLAFFLVAITPVCLATAYRVCLARQELGTRSSYYKKRRGYTGKPSWLKTLKLMRETPHLRMDFLHFTTFWVFAAAVAALLVVHLLR